MTALWAVLPLAAACGGKAGSAARDGALDTTPPPGDASTDQQPDIPAASDAAPDAADAVMDTAAERPPMSPKDVCVAALTAQCMRHAVCQGWAVADCLALEVGHCPDYYFNAQSNRTVENVLACLPALSAMTCTDIAMNIIPPCLLTGKGGPGEPCLYASQCQSFCSDGINRCGTCGTATPVASGAACGSVTTTSCPTTDYCHPTRQVCVPKSSIIYAAQGEPCDFDADPAVGCAGDLICARPSPSLSQGTCQPIPQLGEPCGNAGDLAGQQVCALGLGCDATSRSCQPTDLCGTATCDPTTSFCRTATAPQQAPTCVPYALEGEACDLGTTSTPEIRCASGLGCQGATVAAPAGTCAKPGTVGSACDSSHACASGLQCSAADAGQCTAFDPASCFPGADGGADGP